MARATNKHQIGYIDLLDYNLIKATNGHKIQLTIDGHALNKSGHAFFARSTFNKLFDQKSPEINEPLRQLVVDKATQFHYRYRPLNTFYYVGGRNGSYGYLDFLPAEKFGHIPTKVKTAASSFSILLRNPDY